jgi:hypothetical protein
VAPDARVVYVDDDPIVLSHARALLHCIPDSDVSARRGPDGRRPPGSFLAVTHPARDQVDIATKAEESLTKSMTAMWAGVGRTS